jgi:hypothetical protein
MLDLAVADDDSTFADGPILNCANDVKGSM